MTLAAMLGESPWEVLASDVSERVLERARSGHYAIERATSIPEAHLRACCLKGIGAQQGTFVIDPKIRGCVQFMHINLNDTLPRIGLFDAIFMRHLPGNLLTEPTHDGYNTSLDFPGPMLMISCNYPTFSPAI